MNPIIVFALFIALGTLYYILGKKTSQEVTTTDDYFLASRGLGVRAVTFTLIATQLGGGMLLGTAEQAYKFGIYGILYTLGMALGFMILGSGLAAKLQALNVTTTAQLFETQYKSVLLKKVASALSVITLCGILVAQVVGAQALFAGLGISNPLIFVAFWCFIIFYTMMGGLKAVVIADFFQVCFIIAIFGSIFLYSLYQNPASLKTLFNSSDLFETTNFSLHKISAVLLMPALFSLIEQDLAQRFFAAKTKAVAASSAIFASLFMIIFALVPIYFGMQAQLLGLDVPTGASPLIPVLSFLTHPIIANLAICGIIAAITSTADSLLCAVSSNITQDFVFAHANIKNKLRFSKIVTACVGLVVLGAAYLVPADIIDILIGSYELSVCCLLIPLLFAYMKKSTNKNAAVLSVLGGFIGFIVFRYYPVPLPKELAALGLSLVGYFFGRCL